MVDVAAEADEVARIGSIVVDADAVTPATYAGEETWVGIDKTIEDFRAAYARPEVRAWLREKIGTEYRLSADLLERIIRVHAQHADAHTGRYIILSPTTVAALVDRAKRTVQKGLRILTTLGLFRRTGHGRTGAAVTPAERLAMRRSGDRQHGIPPVRRILRMPAWIRALTGGAPSLDTRSSVLKTPARIRNITKRWGVDNPISPEMLRIAREFDQQGPDGGRFSRRRCHLHAIARLFQQMGVPENADGDALWRSLGDSPALGARNPLGWLRARLRPGVATAALTRCDRLGHDFQDSGWCAHCLTHRDR